jgi:hypothetical protein
MQPPRPGPFDPRPEVELRAALQQLGLERAEAMQCIESTLEWLNGVSSAARLVAAVRRHPLEGLRPPPPKPPIPRAIQRGADAQLALAQALIDARPFATILDVAAVAGVDAQVLAQLLYVGWELRAAPPPPPPPNVVGVLLPMRIETRFTPPVGLAGWKLRVRIVPDAASMDSHDPLASDTELDAVETMWRSCKADLTTDQGKVEWSRFAAALGAARAAWLARTFPAQLVAGEIVITRPATTRTRPRVSQVAGLPKTLELWLTRRGGVPNLVATLDVDSSQLQVDFPDPANSESRWWASFKKAVEVGLGCEIDLGARADNIDALYVVGLGGGDPTSLFQAQRDAGNLAVLPIGTPTNTVDGAPAADLARDAETWRLLVLGIGASDAGAQLVSAAVTGQPNALLPLPGVGLDHTLVNHFMVQSLWPVVFGHALKDVWQLDGAAQELGVWAVDNLLPEGPLPPIRIGDQPYGLLPVSSLGAWKPAAGDPPIEDRMRAGLLTAAGRAAAAAEANGTSFGASTAQLLDLLGRTPASTAYSWRWFLPLDVLHALSWSYGGGVVWQELAKWWDTTAAAVLDLGLAPARRYGTLGFVQDLAIPLVDPDNLPKNVTFKDVIGKLLSVPVRLLLSPGGLRELFERLPNSLLIRLILHALVVSAAEVARESAKVTSPLLEPLWIDSAQQTELANWASTFSTVQLGGGPASVLYDGVRKGAENLPGFDVPTLERVFKATLDTASYRVDPWITAMCARRLRALPNPQFELGVYGWVDRPRPATAGAFAYDFLHAPSEQQALTAAILRDRALSDVEPARWHMDLDSDRVRIAESLAAEVRLGAHISEALGRAVERVVATRADVERLRAQFPIRTEHEGRRVMDGQAVLAQFVSNPSALGLDAPRLAGLQVLNEVVDTYADLLVADAVYDVVAGRAALAQASMDAAAGLAVPPVLDVIKTQRHGRAVNTSVVVALPDATAPGVVDAQTSPGVIADPAVANFLDSAFGGAASAAWTWQVVDTNDAIIGSVSLDQLGLTPIDTLSLSADDLARRAAGALGGAGVAEVMLEAHTRTRRAADLFGRQPATPADLAEAPTAETDAGVQADLLARFATLRSVADQLHTELQAAQAGTPADQDVALRAALRWGITPLTVDDDTPVTQLARAAAALADRLQTAPTNATAATLSVPELARSIAELASPEGRLPVLGRMRLDAVPVSLTQEPAPSAARADLDPDWLEVVAAVRAPVSRLEAFQLEQRVASATPFAAWSNHPGDPWQVNVPVGAIEGLVPASRLVAAFGPTGVLDPGLDPSRFVAIGLLDSWGETVPSTEHTTSVAFHFDAPGARAPQAMLIAVPPVVGTPLDTTGLIDILAEVRALAHARMATPNDVDAHSAGIPLTTFPAMPPTGVSLEPA